MSLLKVTDDLISAAKAQAASQRNANKRRILHPFRRDKDTLSGDAGQTGGTSPVDALRAALYNGPYATSHCDSDTCLRDGSCRARRNVEYTSRNEAPHGVRLPARGFHDLGYRAFGMFHQRDHLGFLLARSVFGLAAFFARPAFFTGLAVLVDV